IANTLGSAFANVSSEDSYSQTFINYKRQQEKRRIDFNTLTSFDHNVDFNFYELKRAIRSSHPSTPGPDGIHHDMLKNLSKKSLGLLLILFNRIWNEHVFPMAWNRAIVIPILKPGKNTEDPSSYRPIALTSCLCKTGENDQRSINTCSGGKEASYRISKWIQIRSQYCGQYFNLRNGNKRRIYHKKASSIDFLLYGKGI
ncbi:hypothetical protein AVEN_177206-1, partial [Araneus ventricosus]